MKKLFKGLFILLFIAGFIFLAVKLNSTQNQLKSTKLDLQGMTFTEGKVVEGKTGGIVTGSVKTWTYFKDDSFITDPKTAGKPVEEIFCNLHKNDLIDSFSGNLFKAKYTKEIIVKVGETEKSYYLVGDYYITK